MNNKLFAQMMSAVDEDLLEEAQRPIKKQPLMKKILPLATIAVCTAACMALIAMTVLQTARPNVEESTMLVNPLRSVTADEIAELGYHMPIPQDAQDPSYFLINLGAQQDVPMAEVRFELDGGAYTCRALKTDVNEDISGVYAEWTQYYTWDTDTVDVTVMAASDSTACASWYDDISGTQWSLSGKRGAADLLNTANVILNTLGYDLSVAPDGAENTAFRALMLGDLHVGETTFVLDGVTYAYRIAATNVVETDFADISGVEDFAEKSVGEIRWCSARLSFDENAAGKIVWFDPAPGLLYSLYMETDATEQALLDMANMLYTPAQDDVG